mmetsp:Transcript_10098/g.17043  ORF Transcript_10098/g.17043 Transcript_10098/m.17043 type:complete len:143 (-) Transcript_10098:355-783(-)|eukprot:CAMPEP_0168622604 /NCGR_PEP_ID=MMETSP0449_2-20121227/8361_1 /TAXON_ID=1082188 /ORGANISM="Strombidium rassoulzadegani, Strain ras09" /LENGTH=142 /DNA_ID=CAMNT_0008663891 /DNA_START=123 /DNA_END=551 /DNA_ORIENTATION=+
MGFSSMLKRAIWTYYTIADELDMHWVPHEKDWLLNEKHYGQIQGLQKDETFKTISKEDLKTWRSEYAEAPPSLDLRDFRHPCHDKKYSNVAPKDLPGAESMIDTVERAKTFWETQMIPQLMEGKRPLIVSHKNTLRAFFKYF